MIIPGGQFLNRKTAKIDEIKKSKNKRDATFKSEGSEKIAVYIIYYKPQKLFINRNNLVTLRTLNTLAN